MAESAVAFVLEKLAPLLKDEVQLWRGGQEEVLYLRQELERMSAFLRVADTIEDSDEEVKLWIKQVRNIAHDTEDILDEFTVLLAHNHGTGLYGFIHKMSCCIKNMKARYRIESEIRAINTRLKSISDEYRRLRQKFLLADQGSNFITRQDQIGNTLHVDQTEVVGIDEQKEKLAMSLFSGGSESKSIFLVGIGGSGKTTLAREVYNDICVKKRFDVQVWLTLSQSSTQEEISRDMAEQLRQTMRKPETNGTVKMSNNQIKKIIKDLLRNRRYLVVLDDLWNQKKWDAIKHDFPTDNCGSRVLITTCNADLAFKSVIDSKGEVYKIESLPTEESWKLFCLKAFKGNSCPSHLEEICKHILRKCGGLPLAIVTISGILAAKDKWRINEWEMVRRRIDAQTEDNDKLIDLRSILSFSFSDLPYYLKSCFLYFSIFPQNHLVDHRRLIRLWVAEGFIEVKEGKTQEEVAEEYFNKLLNRGLMQVVGTTSDGRVKTCCIHDLFREVITYKSREQNFAAIVKEQNTMWPDKVRRLSIQNVSPIIQQQNNSVPQLRSLFFFGVKEHQLLNTLSWDGFTLLTVLDLNGTPLMKFPMEVVNLYYLRYLSLRETRVKTIPRSIARLQNLETLDLKHTYVSELPVEILKLRRLHHLLVYRCIIESYAHFHSKYGCKAPEKIGDWKSIQKLCFIEANQGNGILEELGKLTQLRRLGLIRLRKEDGKTLCSSIENLTSLHALSIKSIEENEMIDLEHITCPPPSLQRLYLTGRLKTLPQWISHVHSLVKIYLKWSQLEDDPLSLLQDLPNLLHLELLQVYSGDILCFKAGGFKKLKILGVDKFDELRCIQVEAGAMTCLEKLSIQRCKLLERVPLGIDHLTRLKVLEFYDISQTLTNTFLLDKEGKDYWKLAQIPEVHFTYWRDGGWEVYSLGTFAGGRHTPWPNTTIGSKDARTLWN